MHVKLDSGMGRLGTLDAEEAARTAELASRTAGVELVGVMTHFATADEADDGGFFEAEHPIRFLVHGEQPSSNVGFGDFEDLPGAAVSADNDVQRDGLFL